MTVAQEDSTRETRPPASLHAVHFYDSDRLLAETVAAFLTEGLGRGEAVISVATAPHQAAVGFHLAEAGVDFHGAAAAGALTLLDAAETLASCSDERGPDQSRFMATIGPVVQRSAAGGRRVRIYGEMVAVLWEAGLRTAAMDLERFWNELPVGTGVCLLCGYPAGSLAGDAPGAERLCQLHSTVTGPPPTGRASVPGRRVAAPMAVRTFPATLDSAGCARRFVLEALADWGCTQVGDEAALVVTELAANAVLHAGSAFTVSVSSFADGIELAVRDEGPLVPRLVDPSVDESWGRGLRLVAGLSARWGTERYGAGKIVFAELEAPPPSGLV